MQKVILFSASNWWRSTNLGKFWCYLAAITKISFCEKIMPCSASGLLNSLRNLVQWSCKNKRQVCLLEFDSQPVALFSLMRKEWPLGTVTVIIFDMWIQSHFCWPGVIYNTLFQWLNWHCVSAGWVCIGKHHSGRQSGPEAKSLRQVSKGIVIINSKLFFHS